MSRNQANIVLIVLVLFIMIVGYLNLSSQSSLKAKKQSFEKFQQSAKEIYLVKRLKKAKSSIISRLNAVKNPTIKDRGSYKVYTYNNLNINELNTLIKKIQGSFLPINKLEIKADATNHATIMMEVLK